MSYTKRRTPSEWQELISEQSQSGETREAFCRARGITLTTFQTAVARQRDRGSFVELAPQPSSGWEGELHFPGGVRVVLRGC